MRSVLQSPSTTLAGGLPKSAMDRRSRRLGCAGVVVRAANTATAEKRAIVDETRHLRHACYDDCASSRRRLDLRVAQTLQLYKPGRVTKEVPVNRLALQHVKC